MIVWINENVKPLLKKGNVDGGLLTNVKSIAFQKYEDLLGMLKALHLRTDWGTALKWC